MIPNFPVPCRSKLTYKRHNILGISVRHVELNLRETRRSFFGLVFQFNSVDMTTVVFSREALALGNLVNYLIAMTTRVVVPAILFLRDGEIFSQLNSLFFR